MAFRAVVLKDSICSYGSRITSFELTYPRIVHSEEMTHRDFSRNSASTRAIPLATQLRNLLENPFIPEKFGINQPGMQAYQHLVGLKHDKAVELWLRGRDRAVTTVLELILGEEIAQEVLQYEPNREFVSGEALLEDFEKLMALIPKSTDQIDLSETSMLNVHKQLAGRGLEAYMWHTIVLTATEFDNYYALRDHPEAQGEIATIARLMKQVHNDSTPTILEEGQWHLPYVEDGEFDDPFDGVRASAARCAATSYNRQHVKNPEREFERYADLRTGGHMSPLEHQATPFSASEYARRQGALEVVEKYLDVQSRVVGPELTDGEYAGIRKAADRLMFSGNLRGWTQHRKQIAHEENFGALRA